MKLKSLIAIVAIPLLLASCGGGFYMLKNDTGPEIKADPDKATIVIYRHLSIGGAIVFNTYLDNKLIGQTKWKSYFVTTTEPGEHVLITSAENNSCAKITLEAGKVYYITTIPTIGVMKARVITSASDPMQFEEQKKELTYYQISVKDADQEDLSLDKETYDETVADYEKELKDKPDRHKDMINLKGY
jgi:hypothetical protein